MQTIRSTAPEVRIFPDGRLDAQSAAAYLGLSYKTLACQRSAGNGPPFIKLGKAVFYQKEDLDGWLASCRVNSTAEYRARRRAFAA
jgi:hypothetical protein